MLTTQKISSAAELVEPAFQDFFSSYAALIHNLSTAMFANMNVISCGLFTKTDCANTIPQR